MTPTKSLHTERFIKIVEQLKKKKVFKSYAKLCETIGIWPQNFNQMKAGKREISLEALKIFSERFEVSLMYLLSGEGKAFATVDKKHSDNVNPLIVTVDGGGKENIVMVESKAAAGYIKGYLQPEYYKKLPTFALPGPQFRNGNFRCFQTEGNSMEYTIRHNDFVIGEHTESIKDIKRGEVYIVVSQDAIVVKRITLIDNEKHTLELTSDNLDYSPYSIKMEEVKEVWKAKAKISFDLSPPQSTLEKQVSSLQSNLSALAKEMKKLKK